MVTMNKIRLLLLLLVGFSSCCLEGEKSRGTFELTYSVCYPDTTITKIIIIPDTCFLYSSDGSNSLVFKNKNGFIRKSIIETTAPIRIEKIEKLNYLNCE